MGSGAAAKSCCPMANGTISSLQASRLKTLGKWLRTNGDAIYETRPCPLTHVTTAEKLKVHFTCRGSQAQPVAVYAIVLVPAGGRIMITIMRVVIRVLCVAV